MCIAFYLAELKFTFHLNAVTPVGSFCGRLLSHSHYYPEKLGGFSKPSHVAIHLLFQVSNEYVEKHVPQHRSCMSPAGL